MLMLRGGTLYTFKKKKTGNIFKKGRTQVRQATSKAINTTGPTALIPFIVE